MDDFVKILDQYLPKKDVVDVVDVADLRPILILAHKNYFHESVKYCTENNLIFNSVRLQNCERISLSDEEKSRPIHIFESRPRYRNSYHSQHQAMFYSNYSQIIEFEYNWDSIIEQVQGRYHRTGPLISPKTIITIKLS
jgi:hypothetical protein